MANKKIIRVYRYVTIYGIKRTFIKVSGRLRWPISLPNFCKKRNISIIGCGQFAFSTIAYFLFFNRRGYFLGAFDIDKKSSSTLAHYYNFKKIYENTEELFSANNCKLIYIASNHASHTPYAISALKKGKDVYIEKPISTSFEQFKHLINAIESAKSNIYVGYNRPFSKAIIQLTKRIHNLNSPISLSCFVSGHMIEKDHWYRNPDEGTRICGNMGHWIDLGIHLLNVVNSCIPKVFSVNISYSDIEEPDDNLNVSIITDNHDVISILLSSRSEPFEGINETINFQCKDVIAKIDDFRRMSIWQNEHKITKKYWPKDVGHRGAILQPFSKNKRDFYEIKISTLLMLMIKDMVIERIVHKRINIENELFKLSI